MNDKRLAPLILIIFAILGIFISVQFRSLIDIRKGNSDEGADIIRELAVMIMDERNRSVELKASIKQIEAKKNDYIETTEINEDIKEELNKTRLAAGMITVSGPGVTIRLNDALPDSDINPNFLIIHDSDMAEILNEANKAGAQAVSINGQRIISTSEMVCTGPTIRINKSRYAVPYVINIIGDKEKLFSELEKSRIVLMLRKYKITVEIKKENELILPAYEYDAGSLVTGLEALKR